MPSLPQSVDVADPLPALSPDNCQYVSMAPSAKLESGNWVSLFEPPSDYAHDTALLLCETAADRWVTWIPDFGEIELCLRQFCPLQ